jgi:hypothetical protein
MAAKNNGSRERMISPFTPFLTGVGEFFLACMVSASDFEGSQLQFENRQDWITRNLLMSIWWREGDGTLSSSYQERRRHLGIRRRLDGWPSKFSLEVAWRQFGWSQDGPDQNTLRGSIRHRSNLCDLAMELGRRSIYRRECATQ